MADCLIIAGPPGTGTAGTEADNGGGTGAGTDAGTAGGTGGGAGAGTGAGTSCGTGLEPVGAKAKAPRQMALAQASRMRQVSCFICNPT